MNDDSALHGYQLAGLGAGRGLLPPDPPPGIVMHSARLPADLPALGKLFQAAFAPALASGRIGDEEGTQAEVAGLIRHPGLAPPGIFVALDGELMVGLAVGRIEVPAAGESSLRAAVELLAVLPAYRRQGIARALLRLLLAWLADRGVETVLARTDDPIVAAMLEQHGFQASTGN
jgi:GNAT superfamily N-acetyltransferase